MLPSPLHLDFRCDCRMWETILRYVPNCLTYPSWVFLINRYPTGGTSYGYPAIVIISSSTPGCCLRLFDFYASKPLVQSIVEHSTKRRGTKCWGTSICKWGFRTFVGIQVTEMAQWTRERSSSAQRGRSHCPWLRSCRGKSWSVWFRFDDKLTKLSSRGNETICASLAPARACISDYTSEIS